MGDRGLLDAFHSIAGDVACCAHAAELWWSREAGIATVRRHARRRLDELVQFARRESPYYRRLYAGLPERGIDLAQLPVATRADLMRHFDDWVTDARVHLADVERFVADRRHNIGKRFRGRYLVWKSSGSTGTPALFLQDPDAVAVYDALVALQWLAVSSPARIMAGARAALVIATEDHYASIASWQRMHRTHPGWRARSFSVLAPLAETVAQLNACRPALLASYPSMLAILAGEKAAGRLSIEPSVLWSGGERLAPHVRKHIERTFGCPVVNEYGASECLVMANGCPSGYLHLNADWVILEPVQRDGRPTPRGRTSDTTLITNLANRVQPVIRYDLGDRVTMRARPCPCGNPLPAFRVEGRSDDLVTLRAAKGACAKLSPVALATVVEHALEGHRFQIAQVAPSALELRLDREDPAARRSAWRRAKPALRAYLEAQGLAGVRLRLAAAAPRLDARSGKLRQVVVERA